MIYVSDFQTTDWSSNTTIASDLKRLVEEQILPPMLSWLNVSGQTSTKTDQNRDDEFRNFSIGEIIFTPKWIAESQLTTALCNVHNHSNTSAESIAVSIRLDDQALDSQKINIAPKSSTRITIKFKAPQSGWHFLSLSTDVSDDLEIDNFKKIPFLVQSRSQLLLIDGDQKTEPMQSETDFLRIALSPFTFSQNAGADYFDTKIIGINQLRDAALSEVSALAICNVSQLDTGISSQLREFAEEGGGIILFLGDRIDMDSWNRAPTIEQGGIRFFAIENSEKVSTESNTRIVIEGFESSLFRELSQSSLSSISTVTINRYSAVSPLPGSKSDTISRLNNDHPWILRHDLGKGAIWVVTTSCDTADTNLPMRPVFVPLMQRLFHAVSHSEPAIEVSHTKTPWRYRFARNASETKLEERLSFRITPPRGTEQTGDEDEWLQTRQVGLYEAKTRLHDQEQVSYCWMDPSPPGEEKNVESTRSDITRDELVKLAESSNARCFDSIDGMLQSEYSSWGGREIGNWFWLAALVCFIAEMLVAQSFGTRRSSARAERTFQQTSNAMRGLE